MRTTTIWIVRTLVLVVSWPALAASLNQFGSTVTVSTYDLAHIGSKTLGQAEGIATRIFAAAGLDARWTTGRSHFPRTW